MKNQSPQSKISKFNPKILEILRCPQSKSELIYDENAQELISEKSNLAYKIVDGIPIMLIEKARQIK